MAATTPATRTPPAVPSRARSPAEAPPPVAAEPASARLSPLTSAELNGALLPMASALKSAPGALRERILRNKALADPDRVTLIDLGGFRRMTDDLDGGGAILSTAAALERLAPLQARHPGGFGCFFQISADEAAAFGHPSADVVALSRATDRGVGREGWHLVTFALSSRTDPRPLAVREIGFADPDAHADFVDAHRAVASASCRRMLAAYDDRAG
jgi:hypothetical protein